MGQENEQVYKGTWWFPASPHEKAAGTLVVNENKIELDFQGEISKSLVWYAETIYGTDLNERPITLQHSSLVQKSFLGMSSGKFQAQVMFLGKHILNNEEAVFDNINVGFNNLEMWASQANLESKSGKNGAILARYRASPDIKIKLPAFELSICLSPAESISLTKISLEQLAFLRIVPNTPLYFNEYRKIIYQLQNFFTLAMNYPTYPTSVYGTTSIGQVPITIHMVTRDYGTRKEVFWASMLFTLRNSKRFIKLYLRKWFLKAEMLETVCNLFFSTFYNPQQYLESTFLTLAQAIETYHRTVWGGTYQPEDQFLETTYKTLTHAIPPKLNPDFKNSLIAGRLRYAFEYSQRKRLQEICQTISKEMSSANYWLWFVESKKSIQTFVGNVIDTRNYLTHHTNELKTKSKHGEDLLNLTKQLNLILQICLLREMGMKPSNIAEVIKTQRLDK